MAYISGFTEIRKARPPRKSPSALYHKIDALYRRTAPHVGASLSHGLRKFKGLVKPEQTYAAWLSGDWHKVMETIPWEEMQEHVQPALEKGAGSLVEAGKLSIASLPFAANPHLRWDTTNPRVRQWIASRTASNFTNLSQDSATNIQRAVAQSMNQALTPRQVAGRIKNSIGLLPRHADAVARYRLNLALTQPSARADAMADAYADKLLDYRAMSIARTETRLATNAGQISVWRESADKGLIDRHRTGKRWIVDGDPCEDCDPMDGMTVPLDSFFTMSDGTTVDFPPLDVHTHCFCGLEIAYDLDPDDFDDGPPEEEEGE